MQFFYAASDGATANRRLRFSSDADNVRLTNVCIIIPDRIFWSIFISLKNYSVANYASIWTLFAPAARGLDVLYNALNVS